MMSSVPVAEHSLAKRNGEDEKIPTQYKYEDLFLRFYSPILKNHLVVDQEYRQSASCVHKTAIRWLEMNTSSVYGFPGELHHPELQQDSSVGIPTGFDSGFLYPFLIAEGLDKRCLDSLLNAVEIHERRQTGFWGYFAPVDAEGTALFPEDIEDTSVSLMALLLAEKKTEDHCRNMVMKQIRNTMRNEDGVMGTWLANLEKGPNGEPRKILYTKPLNEIKVDANSLVNALTFMSMLGMDNEKELLPSVKFISHFVDKLVEAQGKIKLLVEQVYYPNKKSVYLVISRFVAVSSTAKNMFGKKLKELIRSELLDLDIEWTKAMDLACIMLASLYLELHKENENPEVGLKLKNIYAFLPTLQLEDGAFGKHVFFKMSHYGHYAGSKHISTALVVSAMGRYKRQVIEGMDIKYF